uniref:Uncharacterized protein n=1 Tax=Paracidobacterium acidisoli TaxID=2303751 RepID=A0A372IUJ0_9BACT
MKGVNYRNIRTTKASWSRQWRSRPCPCSCSCPCSHCHCSCSRPGLCNRFGLYRHAWLSWP